MELKININSVSYGKRAILKDVNLEIPEGTFVAVIGRNGCGKSTLLSAVSGIIPYSGEIMLDGTDISAMTSRERARQIAIMLQQTKTPHITVSELVAFGRSPHVAMGAKMTEEDLNVIETAIRDAELECIRNCFLDRISGGEVRRSYLGMALAQDTPILLLDEATAFLDTDREMRFLDMIDKKRRESKKTVISVMHNLSAAVKYADSVLLIDNGTSAFFGKTEELLSTDILERTFFVNRFTSVSEGEERIFFST